MKISPPRRKKRPTASAKTASVEISAALTGLKSDVGELREQLTPIQKEISGVTNFIQRKDAELQRYIEGYDWVKQKSLLSDFVALHDELKKNESAFSGDARKKWELLLDIVTVSLDNHGVEMINPGEGDNLDEWKGCVEIASAQPTTNREQNDTICEVLRSGFWIRAGEENKKVTRKARVIVWRVSPCAGTDESATANQQHKEQK